MKLQLLLLLALALSVHAQIGNLGRFLPDFLVDAEGRFKFPKLSDLDISFPNFFPSLGQRITRLSDSSFLLASIAEGSQNLKKWFSSKIDFAKDFLFNGPKFKEPKESNAFENSAFQDANSQSQMQSSLSTKIQTYTSEANTRIAKVVATLKSLFEISPKNLTAVVQRVKNGDFFPLSRQGDTVVKKADGEVVVINVLFDKSTGKFDFNAYKDMASKEKIFDNSAIPLDKNPLLVDEGQYVVRECESDNSIYNSG